MPYRAGYSTEYPVVELIGVHPLGPLPQKFDVFIPGIAAYQNEPRGFVGYLRTATTERI